MTQPLKKIILFAALFWVLGVILAALAFTVFSSGFRIDFEKIPDDYKVSLQPGEKFNLYLCSYEDYPLIDDDVVAFNPDNEKTFSHKKISIRLKKGDANPVFCEGLHQIESEDGQVVSLSWQAKKSSGYFLGISRPLSRPIVAVLLLILFSIILSTIVYRVVSPKIFRAD